MSRTPSRCRVQRIGWRNDLDCCRVYQVGVAFSRSLSHSADAVERIRSLCRVLQVPCCRLPPDLVKEKTVSAELSVAQVLAKLEAQMAYHRERAAHHAELETFHQERRAGHTAEY